MPKRRAFLLLRQTERRNEFYLFSGTSDFKAKGFKDLESED